VLLKQPTFHPPVVKKRPRVQKKKKKREEEKQKEDDERVLYHPIYHAEKPVRKRKKRKIVVSGKDGVGEEAPSRGKTLRMVTNDNYRSMIDIHRNDIKSRTVEMLGQVTSGEEIADRVYSTLERPHLSPSAPPQHRILRQGKLRIYRRVSRVSDERVVATTNDAHLPMPRLRDFLVRVDVAFPVAPSPPPSLPPPPPPPPGADSRSDTIEMNSNGMQAVSPTIGIHSNDLSWKGSDVDHKTPGPLHPTETALVRSEKVQKWKNKKEGMRKNRGQEAGPRQGKAGEPTIKSIFQEHTRALEFDTATKTRRVSVVEGMLVDWLENKMDLVGMVEQSGDYVDPRVREFLGKKPLQQNWPHQVDGLIFGINRENTPYLGSRGGLLCDEMGLGKSKWMQEMVLRRIQQRMLKMPGKRFVRPSLIVVKKTLVYNIINEFAINFPEDMLNVVYFCDRENLASSVDQICKNVDVIVTTYSTLQRAFASRFVATKGNGPHSAYKTKWRRRTAFEILQQKNRTASNACYDVLYDPNLVLEQVIADEAHLIVNQNSVRYHALTNLNYKCGWFVTGTPVQNSLSDIEAAFWFIKIDPACIPATPTIRVAKDSRALLTAKLRDTFMGLADFEERIAFMKLFYILTNKGKKTAHGTISGARSSLHLENVARKQHSSEHGSMFDLFEKSLDSDELEYDSIMHDEDDDDDDDDDDESGYVSKRNYTNTDEAEAREAEEGEDEEEEPYWKERRRRSDLQRKWHEDIETRQVANKGLKAFSNHYIRISVVENNDFTKSVESRILNTIFSIICKTTGSTNVLGISHYSTKIVEIMNTVMLRRTKASLGIDFDASTRAGKTFDVTLTNGTVIKKRADERGMINLPYLRTHALFSRVGDTFGEEVRVYTMTSSEMLLYAFYDGYQKYLKTHPTEENIFNYRKAEPVRLTGTAYSVVQERETYAEIVKRYEAIIGKDSLTEIDNMVSSIYVNRGGVIERRKNDVETLHQSHSIMSAYVLMAMNGLQAICNQLGAMSRVFLPSFLLPPRQDRQDPLRSARRNYTFYQDAQRNGCSQFDLNTEYLRVNTPPAEVIENCKEVARELNIDLGTSDIDGFFRGEHPIHLPQESSQFLQLKHLLDNHVAGEKAIFTFNSVNTMLLLYYHIRKWYPEDPDCPIRPLIMSGDMPTPRRRLVGDLFKNDHRYNILIASSQLVWLGHNYQCANNMYFSDAWYMPQRPRQAVFRMMRPGQMRYTRMVSIVPKGTIVEMILLLDDDKMTTEESVVGGTRGRHSNAQSVISQVLSSFLDTYREGALKKRVSLLGF